MFVIIILFLRFQTYCLKFPDGKEILETNVLFFHNISFLGMLFLVHHRIPHPQFTRNAKFQLPSPFSSKIINPWHFLGPRGTL